MEPDKLDAFFMTERLSFTAKYRTAATIKAYVEAYPGIWNNSSHFIRAAIARYLERQKQEGRHAEVKH